MPRRNKKGQFVKGGSSGGSRRRRRRRTNPSTSRRRSSPSTSRRRRRRRNPEGGGGGNGINLSTGFVDLSPVIFAHLALAFGLRTFGAKWGPSAMTGAATTSPYSGQAWPFANYAYGLGFGYAVAKIMQRWKGAHWAKVFWQTICRECVRRFIWTEAVAKIPGAQTYLGQGDAPGTVWRDNSGNTWQLDYAGRWQTMQGFTEQRALDGGDETLVMQRPLDGLTSARSIDRANGGYGPRYLQGLMAPTTDELALRGAYTGSGYVDPYNAVYS